MLSFDFEPPDPSHRLVSTLGVPELGFGSAFILCFLCCLLFNCIVTAEVLPRWGRLRLLAYYRSCGQSGDYPEGQIYQHKIHCKHGPVLQPEISHAGPRQKEQEKCE